MSTTPTPSLLASILSADFPTYLIFCLIIPWTCIVYKTFAGKADASGCLPIVVAFFSAVIGFFAAQSADQFPWDSDGRGLQPPSQSYMMRRNNAFWHMFQYLIFLPFIVPVLPSAIFGWVYQKVTGRPPWYWEPSPTDDAPNHNADAADADAAKPKQPRAPTKRRKRHPKGPKPEKEPPDDAPNS